MNKDILSYYNEELDYLRTAGNEFGKKYPQIAGSLRIDQNRAQDPMVARLTESFAFLTAKLSHQLDGENLELAQTLLNLMYPYLLQPVPALSTIQLNPSPDVVSPITVNRGTELETNVVIEEASSDHATKCYFRSCYPVSVVPFSVEDAKVMRGVDIRSHGLPITHKACIYVKLAKTCEEDIKPCLDVDCLRFHINVQKQYANLVYECIFNQVVQVVLYSKSLKKHVTLDPNVIKTVGFANNEDLLNLPGIQFDGIRMLTEYSVFSEKFMYFDITGLKEAISELGTCEFDLLFCMQTANNQLSAAINETSFMLNCTPIVNLFQAKSDVFKVDHKHAMYHLKVESGQSPWEIEIYKISSLHGCSENGDKINFKSRYNNNYSDLMKISDSCPLVYWDYIRKPIWHFGVEHQLGNEMMLRFVTDNGSDNQLDMDQSWTVMADCWCTNRDLPSKIVVSVDSVFSLPSKYNTLVNVRCLNQPTAPIWPSLDKNEHWELLAILVRSQQSLSDINFGLNNLKTIISSLNLSDLDEINLIMDQMIKLNVERISMRYPGEHILTFVRGLKIIIEFKQIGFQEHDLFFFGTVLSRFLNQYCTLDSFIKLQFNGEHKGRVFEWNPQFGTQALI